MRFLDVDRGFEQNAQSWRRPTSPTATVGANASAGIDLPIPLTAGEAKAEHETVLCGSDMEQPVPAEAKIVLGIRGLV